MQLGLNNILALQGNSLGQGLRNVSLAGSLFGQSGAAGMFGVLLGDAQNNAIPQDSHAVILDPQLGIQTNNKANDFTVGSPLLKNYDMTEADKILNPEKIAVQNITEDNFSIDGFVLLNAEGKLQITDENGVLIDAEFVEILAENPLVKEFLSQKLRNGEKISLGEDVLQALAHKNGNIASQIVIENDTLVFGSPTTAETITEATAHGAKLSNEWTISQKAENSIIAPVAQDTKSAPSHNTTVQNTSSQAQTQTTITSSEGFSMGSGTDNGSDFSQNFNGDLSLDGDWSQTQSQRNNTAQNFASHLAHTKPMTSYHASVAEQVSMQIQKGVQGQIDKISLQLNPIELGKVTIDFDFSDSHHGKILISAEKSETLDMLRQDARTLQKILSDAGMDAGKNSLEFSLGHNQNQYQDADKSKKINDVKFDITAIENLGTEIESIVIPSSGVIAVGKVNIVV